MRKTVTVFGATGTAGSACVDELIEQKLFDVQVLVRMGRDTDRSTMQGGRAERDGRAFTLAGRPAA